MLLVWWGLVCFRVWFVVCFGVCFVVGWWCCRGSVVVCGGGVCPLVWWGCFFVAWVVGVVSEAKWSLALSAFQTGASALIDPTARCGRCRNRKNAHYKNHGHSVLFLRAFGVLNPRAVVYTTAKTPNKKLASTLCCFLGKTPRS